MSNKCPNECGELETSSGHIYTNDGRTYFKVFVEYCPECLYVNDVEARL